MAGKPNRQRKRPSAREALLDAAVAEFASKGYERATVAGIAARAGVTTGAVYTHFRSKLELLLEAVGLNTVEAFTRRSFAIAGKPAAEVAPALARGLVAPPAGRRDRLLIDAIVFARRDPKVAEAYRRVIQARASRRSSGPRARAWSRGGSIRRCRTRRARASGPGSRLRRGRAARARRVAAERRDRGAARPSSCRSPRARTRQERGACSRASSRARAPPNARAPSCSR
jgi:AcrR family transcriptional regulator